ncbi:hypothetical protein CROQUDRAFT_49284 [Cronartium quercuum f. sp. fusiforme G11]|uniref:Phosphatidic acid phosphatase type 2/haloperoxidase domain-containing protein n=1 Tax=Cronartium quercuum f. sp. fusiforme G11 TaxID=708437 RepID=A0A9P6NFD2_9BASI|nr:hypothetical protein CROQUDRAFT_49284 [Cronartium quercuum f. sp. fusiforme G11]
MSSPIPNPQSRFSSHHDPSRPQDRFGLLPEALFQTRQSNSSRNTAKARRWNLLKSYLPDWLITLVFYVGFYFLDNLAGFQREFDLNDTSIQHTHAEVERVPVLFLAIYAIAIPAFIILLCSQALLRSFWDTHNGLLGLFLSLALTLAVTGSVKNTVGRPRPDFIFRCQPATGSANAAIGLSNSSICTTDHESRLLVDGFRSFPSGHSSTAWCGLGYLSLYLAGKVHLFDRRGHTLKAWLVLIPLVGAALIAISRTMDYRHHWQDVLIGSLIGVVMAYLSYRLYYPSLSSAESHKPHSPRIQDGQKHSRTTSELPFVRPQNINCDRTSTESDDIMLQPATDVPEPAHHHSFRELDSPFKPLPRV